MKKLFFVLAAMILSAVTSSAQIGTVLIDASGFAKYELISNQAVTAAAGQSTTVRGNGFVSSVGGVTFTPLATTTVLHISASGGTAEDVTPSAVSCSMNAIENSCSFTATFSYAHDAGFKITSGDFGADEAIRSSSRGDLVIVEKVVAPLTLTGASTTATGAIPADVFLLGVTARVTTVITGATSWTLGDGSDVDLWGTGLGLTLGPKVDFSTYTSATNATGLYIAAGNMVATATGSNFTGGVVSFEVTYYKIVK